MFRYLYPDIEDYRLINFQIGFQITPTATISHSAIICEALKMFSDKSNGFFK